MTSAGPDPDKVLLTPGSQVPGVTITASTGYLPNIAFYVDYLRRAEERGGFETKENGTSDYADDDYIGPVDFMTEDRYMDCLDKANWQFVFNVWGDEIEDVEGKNGWSASAIDLGSSGKTGLGSFIKATDATVNWMLFNEKHGAKPDYKFTKNTGNNRGTLISYFDYIDWVLNYAEGDGNGLFTAEDRQTWLTFEAFCVWKRMEPWDMYYRSANLLDAGKSQAGANLYKLNKTRIGLDIPVLSGVNKRGIHYYYQNISNAITIKIRLNLSSGSIFDFETPQARWYGIATNYTNAIMETIEGIFDPYYEIVHGGVFDNYIEYSGRTIPSDQAGNYLALHIEYEDNFVTAPPTLVEKAKKLLPDYATYKAACELYDADTTHGDRLNDAGENTEEFMAWYQLAGSQAAIKTRVASYDDNVLLREILMNDLEYSQSIAATFFYDGQDLREKSDPGTSLSGGAAADKLLLVTLANISFNAFKTAAKLLYEESFSNMRDANKNTISTIPYDKYMYYWATSYAKSTITSGNTYSQVTGFAVPIGDVALRDDDTGAIIKSYNTANTPRGSEIFWQEFYGSAADDAYGVGGRKYDPLYNRAEDPEEDSADENKITVAHW